MQCKKYMETKSGNIKEIKEGNLSNLICKDYDKKNRI